MKTLEIAIVGAGPAGLAAALFLGRAGHRVTIFERFDAPKPLGSGLILQPTGLAVLDRLGLLADILARGARIDRLFGHEVGSRRIVLDARYGSSGRSGGRFGLAVHRAALFGVLHEAALRQGTGIETAVQVEDFVPSGSGSAGGSLIDAAGRRFGRFDLVVDASGARSPLRRRLFDATTPVPLAYGAVWTTLDWVGGFDAHALTQAYQRASVMIGILPVGRQSPDARDQAAFFWSLKVDDHAALVAGGIEAWKARVRGLWPEVEPYLAQIDHVDQLVLARYQHHTLTRPYGEGIVAIGDCAHSASPQLGQGANMALLDAAALAAALATGADLPAALSRYAGMRRLHVRTYQALSRVFTPFYQSDSLALPFLRDRLVSALSRIPPGPQVLSGIVSGMLVDPLTPIGIEEPDWAAVAPDER